MGRLYIEPEVEAKLQEPVIQALEAYFDHVYTPDTKHGSVGTMASTSDDQIIVFNAFKMSREHTPEVLAILAQLGGQLAAIDNE